jgi:hypothetical protein
LHIIKKDNELLHRALLNINAIIYSDHEDLIVHLSDGEYPAKPHQKFETEIIKRAIDDAKEKAKKATSLLKNILKMYYPMSQ